MAESIIDSSVRYDVAKGMFYTRLKRDHFAWNRHLPAFVMPNAGQPAERPGQQRAKQANVQAEYAQRPGLQR
jgi:hypothetical protein